MKPPKFYDTSTTAMHTVDVASLLIADTACLTHVHMSGLCMCSFYYIIYLHTLKPQSDTCKMFTHINLPTCMQLQKCI